VNEKLKRLCKGRLDGTASCGEREGRMLRIQGQRSQNRGKKKKGKRNQGGKGVFYFM